MSEFKEFSSAGLPDCGIQFLTDFWKEKYLQEYIKNGGSKIKFVTGRKGSGKTHFLRLITSLALGENYKTVHFSAKDVKFMWKFSASAASLTALRQSAAI